MTYREAIQYIKTNHADFWTWLQEHPNRLERFKAQLMEAAPDIRMGSDPEALTNWLSQSTAFTLWRDAQPVAEAAPEELVPAEPGAEPTTPIDPFAAQAASDVRGSFLLFLQENELPTSLMTFIEGAIGQKWSFDEIVAKLRETPEYLAAYPENKLRQEAGLSWWPEARIREYRDTVRRIARDYLALAPTEVSNEEIAHLVAGEVDLGEWERRIQVHAQFLQWGPSVKEALSQELGYDVPDERVFAFMNPDIPTPELDLAYRRALTRGQPAVLGFGIRPQEEADLLIQMGFSPEEAFAGYQGIAAELPRVERMRMIEAYLNEQSGQTPTNPLGEASFGLLWRALMARDVDAHNVLSGMLARATAEWQAGGGPAGGGTGLAVSGAS